MVIRVSSNVSDLTGQGIEYLTDSEGNIIARFFDGNFPQAAEAVDGDAVTIAEAA